MVDPYESNASVRLLLDQKSNFRLYSTFLKILLTTQRFGTTLKKLPGFLSRVFLSGYLLFIRVFLLQGHPELDIFSYKIISPHFLTPPLLMWQENVDFTRMQRFWNSGTCRTWRKQVRQICQVVWPNVHNTFADLSLCFNFGPADFHSVCLYSNSAGPNVRHSVWSFQNVWECLLL